MELVRSNRPEHLADALASKVRAKPLNPFEKEVVVVQNRGTESWLTLALAERLGSWSNPSFPFPRSVIEEVLGLFSERSEGAACYAPERLKWTIARLLHESAPAELLAYLGQPADPDRVLRFAASISAVLDDYVVFRPELLKHWARTDEGDWQADLWRRVANELGPHDLASRIDAALPLLRSGLPKDKLPFQRLHLFALETLPPLFLHFFSELSRSIQTTLYVLEPSSEYLGDIDLAPSGSAAADGHSFVSDLGRLSRDFQQVLLSEDDSVQARSEFFSAPERNSLLRSLQADMLEFRSPSDDGSRRAIEASDQSISIHACAGPMREAQALHGLLRAAFEDDPTLQPEDVIVMTPDLETYAPVFRAVFGQDEGHRIPYEVHDRLTRDDAGFHDDFLAVLEVLDSRFSVFDLVRLLDASAMREDFRFTMDERARLTELLAAAGVRWGIDAEHRASLEFPPEPLHTWRAGLGRLYLGFASSPEDTKAFEGLLPRGAPSLGDAELLARFSSLCELLFEIQPQARRAHGLKAWAELLEGVATALFAEDDQSSQASRMLRGAIVELYELAKLSGYESAIPLKTVRRELAGLLLKGTPAVGFLRRGVTFAELVPLRSIPFRVVCLVGMSEDAFPRSDSRPSFDLTREARLPGDRNKRDDDRHAFLQAVLCARDRLIITYGAPSGSSRTEANPSPVVWELCETANRYYEQPSGKHVLEATSHPLHAFDSAYFDGGELPQSASGRYLQIAQALSEPAVERARVELRTEDAVSDRTVSVGELTSWLWHPITSFIDKVLLARFGGSELYEPTSAITKIGPLEAAIVGNGALRAGLRSDALAEYLAAAPEFPDGTWGALQRHALAREVTALNARMDEVQGASETRSELLSVQLGEIVLESRVDGLGPDQRVLKRFTRPEGKAELAAWIEHLLVEVAGEPGARLPTQLVLRGDETQASQVSFHVPDDARKLLEDLLAMYRSCQEAPLPLMGPVSRAFAKRFDPEKPLKALGTAKRELSVEIQRSERLAYVFGNDNPLSDEHWSESFQRAALAVYGPLLAHRREP